MSGYILCQTKRAQVPFYIENISANIYSIEELCYYLYHNLYLIDDSIINEELCKWLEKELNLTKLSIKIAVKITEKYNLTEILYLIFKEINYLSYEELKSFSEKLKIFEKEKPLEKEKKKGDALIANKMYVNAIKAYHTLLQKMEAAEEKGELFADVLHNMGCAYGYLFQTEKAFACFEKAYKLYGKKESLKAYLLAWKNLKGDDSWRERAVQLGTADVIIKEIDDKINHFENRKVFELKKKEADIIINKLIKEYHRSTGS